MHDFPFTLSPTPAEFEHLAARYDCIPLVATLICDEMTPVSAFARLEADNPRAFLLESVVGGESVARYSFLGAGPARTFEATRTRVRWSDHATATLSEQDCADPLAELERELARWKAPHRPGLPHFLGGAVGYASYDVVRYYERLPHTPADDRGLPDLLFDLYDTLVIFDHARKLTLVVSHALLSHEGSGTDAAAGRTANPANRRAADPATCRAAYAAAAARIQHVIAQLARPLDWQPLPVALPAPPLKRVTSNFTQAGFEAVVEKCKEYIRAGDIFQVVPSQRLQVETAADPLDIYRALRVINPSPFMFYLKSPEVRLVGASPEIMCRVAGGVVTTRPLAGTRRRGDTPEEDQRLRDELLADPKERAEHIMLVDLGRNDVGRVARPGGVQIRDVMSVEYYSHVMHISSTVTGELAEGRTAFDALRAALPVGTVSGAPKVRAMEIVDECEPTRRGPYAGAVGYFDFTGDMDTCITLRTLVLQPTVAPTADAAAPGTSTAAAPSGSDRSAPDVSNAAAPASSGAAPSISNGAAAAGAAPANAPSTKHALWRAWVQAGAGIVADSVPAREWQETLNKAQSLLTAIRLVEEQFDRGRMAAARSSHDEP